MGGLHVAHREFRALHDGQFAHIRHAQIARRVILSRPAAIAEKQKSPHSPAIPPQHEGRYGRSSRNVRRGCDGRKARKDEARDAFDEAVWSRHPDAGVKPATLAMSAFGRHAVLATVAIKPGTPRRARNKSSNIARGMPDVFGCTCDWLVCVFLAFCCTRSGGCNGTRHFPRPLPGGQAHRTRADLLRES
jgi:hypothetical protein